MTTRYEVHIHWYGRPPVKRGPCEGLPDFPKHLWQKITRRPVGLERAKGIADAQPTHACVYEWLTTKRVHDNGLTPLTPKGWKEADPC